MQRILIVVSAIALFIASFWTVSAMMGDDDGKLRDAVRAADALALKAALEQYYQKRGKFPFLFADNPVQDLKAELAGVLDTIPRDPAWPGTPRDYRYVSADGTSYGLKFNLERASGPVPAGGSCVTGVKFAGKGWWGQQPTCPF